MPFPPPPRLHLAPEAAASVRQAWAAALDAEPCGYLVGQADDLGVLRVAGAWPGRNAHPYPRDAFLLDPDEQLEVRRRARTEGFRLLGIWHGHLKGAATPSLADVAGADAMAPPVMLLAGREGADPPRLRAYVRTGTTWAVLPLRVDAPPTA